MGDVQTDMREVGHHREEVGPRNLQVWLGGWRAELRTEMIGARHGAIESGKLFLKKTQKRLGMIGCESLFISGK